MSEHAVAHTDELEDGDRILTEIEGREIAVYQVDGEYRAYLNWCPHQAGPVCEGALSGTCESVYDEASLEWKTEWSEDKTVINCPWHGWEFDVTDGTLLARDDVSLASYSVTVEDGQILVEL